MTDRPPVESSRWKAVSSGLFLILIGMIVWDGADRRAVDPTRPVQYGSIMSEGQTLPKTLKIGSFNIHGGKGIDGIRDLSRTAELLSDVEVAGLYEVRAIAEFDQPNQAAALGHRCQAGWLFAPSERQWWSDHFGNGLIHRIPVHSIVRIPLVNTRGKAYRNAILSTADLEGATVRILAVHIDRESDRRHQLQTMIDLFLNLQEPCLLMGDLNTNSQDPQLAGLRDHSGVHSPLHETHTEQSLENQIDWIFTRGLRTVAAELVENRASDHPILKAEFEPIAQ